MMGYDYRQARSKGLPRRPSLECVSDSGESSSRCSNSNSNSSSDDSESRDASDSTTESCRERRKVRFEDSANRTIQVAKYSDAGEKMMIWYTGGDFLKFQRNFRKSKSESTIASMPSSSSPASSSSSSSSTQSLSSSYSLSSSGNTRNRKHRPMETLESFNGSERSRRSRKTVSRSVLLHQDFYRRRSDELTLVDVDTHERLSAISSSLTEQDRILAIKAAESNAHETECFRIEDEHLKTQRLQDEDEEESMVGRFIVADDLNNNLTSSSPFCFVQYYKPVSPGVLLSKILLCGCE